MNERHLAELQNRAAGLPTADAQRAALGIRSAAEMAAAQTRAMASAFACGTGAVVMNFDPASGTVHCRAVDMRNPSGTETREA